jgi:hypothetical protein
VTRAAADSCLAQPTQNERSERQPPEHPASVLAAASLRLSSSISDPIALSFPLHTTVEDHVANHAEIRQSR